MHETAIPNPERELLEQLQQRIDRYQPLLEHEFKLSLGRVVAAPLRVGELIDHAFEKARQSLWRESFTRRARPPDVWRRLLFATDKLLVRLPAQACLFLRFRLSPPCLIRRRSQLHRYISKSGAVCAKAIRRSRAESRH